MAILINSPFNQIWCAAVNNNFLYVIQAGPTDGKITKHQLDGTLIDGNWGQSQQFTRPSHVNQMISYKNYLFVAVDDGGRDGIQRIVINNDGTCGAITNWYPTSFPYVLTCVGDSIYFVTGTGIINKIDINSDGTPGTFTTFSSVLSNIKVESITYYNSAFYLTAMNNRIIKLNSDGSVNNLNWSNNVIVNNQHEVVVLIITNEYIYSGNSNGTIRQLDLSGNLINSTWFNLGYGLGGFGKMFLYSGNIYIHGDGANLYIVPLVIPPQYAKIRINYSSIVNGNSVRGLVFEGYYGYQSNNKITEFYSSGDLSTNLIIPSTDPFVTGALTLLGKTTSNIASNAGIDTTSTHAGVFVKNLPFVNALFKSNPYVLLKPSGIIMFDNYGLVNTNVLATSYFANKYVMSNGNVYSNKNNSFFSFSNFTFTYNTVSALPSVNAPIPIDYTFFNAIKQIKYNAKYNGAVLLDSYFVFYLDSSNNYHMCAQYPTTENKNVLLFSDASCDNFPNTGNFGNTLGTVNPDPTVTTIVAVSGNAATATVTTSTVSATGTPTVSATVSATGTVTAVNLNALNSNICFSEGSIVTTDQGEVEIQNIDITYHTIRNNKIIALTETQSVDDYLVKINKNAFGNVPTQDTETTGNHMIFNGLSMVRAKTMINNDTIEKIPYRGLPLYNILLEKHDIMMVNCLVCETLNPENPIAKYYVMMAENPENKIEMENMWRKRTQEIIHAI